MKARMHTRLTRSETGSSLVEVALFMPVLLTLMLGVVDFGRAYYEANEVMGAAHAGAVFGSQNPTDTTDMQTVATDNAKDVPGISSTASYGCECSDGTGASVSCASPPSCSTTTEVYYVKVKASASYSPIVPWPRFGTSFTIAETVEMRSSVP
jgi:Flp pilus assembly protein TadG